MKHLLYIILMLCIQKFSLSQWSVVNQEAAVSIDFIIPSTGIILIRATEFDEENVILGTSDYGVSWDTLLVLPNTVYPWDAVYASENVLYVSAEPHYVRKSIDGGETWFDPGQEPPTFTDMWFTTELVGYGIYHDGMPIYAKTFDGGQTWQNITTSLAGRDIQFYDACHGQFGMSCCIYRTQNCGDDWEETNYEFENRSINTLWYHDSNTGFLGTIGAFGTYFNFNYGSIIKVTEGIDPELIDIPYIQQVNDMFWIDTDLGFTANTAFSGFPYGIMATDNGGVTWGIQDIEVPIGEENPSVWEIDCPGEGICYAIGNHVYKTTNLGGPISEAFTIDVGTSKIQETNEITIFPTIASTTVHISGIDIEKKYEIDVYNSLGELIIQSQKTSEIDISKLTSGAYYLKIRLIDIKESINNTYLIAKHFIKQ